MRCERRPVLKHDQKIGAQGIGDHLRCEDRRLGADVAGRIVINGHGHPGYAPGIHPQAFREGGRGREVILPLIIVGAGVHHHLDHAGGRVTAVINAQVKAVARVRRESGGVDGHQRVKAVALVDRQPLIGVSQEGERDGLGLRGIILPPIPDAPVAHQALAGLEGGIIQLAARERINDLAGVGEHVVVGSGRVLGDVDDDDPLSPGQRIHSNQVRLHRGRHREPVGAKHQGVGEEAAGEHFCHHRAGAVRQIKIQLAGVVGQDRPPKSLACSTGESVGGLDLGRFPVRGGAVVLDAVSVKNTHVGSAAGLVSGRISGRQIDLGGIADKVIDGRHRLQEEVEGARHRVRCVPVEVGGKPPPIVRGGEPGQAERGERIGQGCIYHQVIGPPLRQEIAVAVREEAQAIQRVGAQRRDRRKRGSGETEVINARLRHIDRVPDALAGGPFDVVYPGRFQGAQGGILQRGRAKTRDFLAGRSVDVSQDLGSRPGDGPQIFASQIIGQRLPQRGRNRRRRFDEIVGRIRDLGHVEIHERAFMPQFRIYS